MPGTMLRGLFLNLIIFVYESLSNWAWLFSGYFTEFDVIFYVLFNYFEMFQFLPWHEVPVK